nr:zinc finger, CCHC-type [Tanacetum cinerariifolium]
TPNKNSKQTPYEIWTKKVPNLTYLRVWGCRAVVRLTEPKMKNLGEKESRDAIFDEERFTSIPRSMIQPSSSKITEDEVEGADDVPGPSEAIQSEIDSIMHNDTWELTDLPPGCKALGCKWILKRKMKVDGSIDKYKARLVIQGFRQKEGIDFFDTYAPVARISTIRLLLALAGIHDLVIHQMDVKTAFLNGDLDEEIYMKQPEGFVMPGHESKVCKLKKSLYGLKQAPKQWHQKFVDVVLSNGFSLNQADKCVYSRFDASSKGVIICLYVDDMLILGTDQDQVNKTKEFLSSKFDMKDLGEAGVILGIKIKRGNNEAVQSEIDSIMHNDNWELTDLPHGCKTLGCKWILKRKKKVDSSIDKYKARLVIKGFRQKEGIDLFDTYASIARIFTIRLLLALAAIHDLVIHQMDVKTAFLNGDLYEEIYMKQPKDQFNKTKKFLSSKFDMKDLGEAEVILGIRIKRGNDVSQLEYSRAIGCLMYAMISTRQDIAFAIVKLSRYTSNPSALHWQALGRVFQYLKRTMDYGLTYSGYPSVIEDNRTMAQMLQASIEGYEDAIVVPPFNANNFELKQMLINLVQSNQFTGRQDPHNHLRFFNKVTSTFRHPEVPNTTVKLLLFPFSLEGEARIWLDKEPPRSILT